MKSARVLHEARDIPMRLPVSGRIRVGTKVLTKAAETCPVADQLKDIYSRGLNAMVPFDRIEAAMAKVEGAPKTPLMPTNTDAFRVCAADFSDPNAVNVIMVNHADEDGELRSFPVVFPSEDLDMIFRESFESWKGGKLHRWSDPDPKTGELQCMHRLDPEPQSRRIRWGGRPVEALHSCDPNQCDLFDRSECKHHGSLCFWIPGIIGAGIIEMNFTSMYASAGITEMVGIVRQGLGKISGLYRDKPIFRISKALKSVSRVNWETGKVAKSKHWIIQLTADLDMCEQIALPAPTDTLAIEEQTEE